MKKNIFTILIVVLIIGIAYYSLPLSALEKSPVLHIDLALVGDFNDPLLDGNNTSRTIEMVPLIKQNRGPYELAPNSIICDVFYDQQKISYNSVITPYHGPGNYSLDIAFKDDVRLPQYSQQAVNIQLQFIVGKVVVETLYFGVFWENSTELQ